MTVAGAVVAAVAAVASITISCVQYSKNVAAAHKAEKKAEKRAGASKSRDQEMAKRQLRSAAIELGRRQLEVSSAKQKRKGAMHEASASSANVTVAGSNPSARPAGRPVVG